MPDRNGLPAVVLYNFEGFDAIRGIASELIAGGHPVVAACPAQSPLADEARASGCLVADADRGNALRTGVTFVSANLMDLPGVVTVNMNDGYSAEDISAVAGALAANPGKLIAASRKDAPGIGAFARMERLLAWLAFALVHGRSVKDPWAGLRAIPSALIPALLDIKGEDGQYEFNIVLNLQHMGAKAVSVPVSAPYALSDGSGFRERARDILRVLILPFKFISASFAATLADYIIFFLLDKLLLKGPWAWAYSTTVSRSAGAVVGYFLNRSLVFRQKNNTWRKEAAAAGLFALLALFNYGASMLIIYVLHVLLHLDEGFAKPIADALLFVTSYTVQREIIFRRKNPATDSQ